MCSGGPSGGTATRIAHAAVLTTLTYLCQGGIYDHVGGGFARYSVDAAWLVPHFEKMLYDNGQLLSLLSYAYHETMRPLFRHRIDETVGWLLREMQLPGGGFASSLDADTEHEEGLTYVWSWDELQEALGADFEIFAQILRRDRPAATGRAATSSTASRPLRANGWAKPRKRHCGRCGRSCSAGATSAPQPGRDDKVLADWNGLAITGLAHAARVSVSGDARQARARGLSFRLRIRWRTATGSRIRGSMEASSIRASRPTTPT